MATKDEVLKKLTSTFLRLDTAADNAVGALEELKGCLRDFKRVIGYIEDIEEVE